MELYTYVERERERERERESSHDIHPIPSFQLGKRREMKSDHKP